MATIREIFEQAVAYHQSGQLQLAEQAYRQTLEADPCHAESLHLLGLLVAQSGRNETAAAYIGRAIALKPGVAAFHYNLALVHQALKNPAEAIACYRRAVSITPDYAEAYNNLGIALKEQGQLEEALTCYRRALTIKPDYAEVHHNLGNAWKEQGKHRESVECFERALAIRPDYAAARIGLGNALCQLGTARKAKGELREAAACYRRALAVRPEFVEAHSNLGLVLQEQGKLDQAIQCYRRALEFDPDSGAVESNLGNALRQQGNLADALACCRRACELKPGLAEAHNNLGTVLKEQGNLEEALACFERALQIEPDCAAAHWNRALIDLLTGDFARGWREYAWRWQTTQQVRRPFPQPEWDGQPLAEKTLLLHAEQGLGDTIQCIRYAPWVKQRAARLIVECQRPLFRLLSGFPGIDQLVAQGDALPPFDVQLPLLSLPGIHGTNGENVPARNPYLFAAAELVQRWRQRLSTLEGVKIGISWQGNPKYASDRYRSIPLIQFAALAEIPGVCWISLQKGFGAEQLGAAGDCFRVRDFAGELDEASGPFMDTAAIMRNLDLVITSDTVNAHLAGALGVPVWVALPFVPDWRWLLNRSDTPWYPTMRLFRQGKPGDWPGVFADLQAALRARLRSEHAAS